VLDEDKFIYYENANDAKFKSNGKEMILQANSAVSYTAKQCCLLIKHIERDDRSEVTPDDWLLLADSEE
jgi:hypothetical protein